MENTHICKYNKELSEAKAKAGIFWQVLSIFDAVMTAIGKKIRTSSISNEDNWKNYSVTDKFFRGYVRHTQKIFLMLENFRRC